MSAWIRLLEVMRAEVGDELADALEARIRRDLAAVAIRVPGAIRPAPDRLRLQTAAKPAPRPRLIR